MTKGAVIQKNRWFSGRWKWEKGGAVLIAAGKKAGPISPMGPIGPVEWLPGLAVADHATPAGCGR